MQGHGGKAGKKPVFKASLFVISIEMQYLIAVIVIAVIVMVMSPLALCQGR
jgi:hypothetical protein